MYNIHTLLARTVFNQRFYRARAMDTHIMNFVHVPQFNSTNATHLKLSHLSKKAHDVAKRLYQQNDMLAETELSIIEREIDGLVARLYGISDNELEVIRKSIEFFKE